MINERIKFKCREVRLIDTDGKQAGIVSVEDALEKAREKDLDLVLIAPEERPPVCRIANYGKLKYEMGKREREARKGSKAAGVLKEIKVRPKISEHDLQVRISKIEEFFKKGHKVKVTLTFRGREVSHPEIGSRVLHRLMEGVSNFGLAEGPPKRDGKNLILLLTPK